MRNVGEDPMGLWAATATSSSSAAARWGYVIWHIDGVDGELKHRAFFLIEIAFMLTGPFSWSSARRPTSGTQRTLP